MFFYRRLLNNIKFLIYYKKNKNFTSQTKETNKIILYDKEFFYPKHSICYEEYLKKLQVEAPGPGTAFTSEYNSINKNFFDNKIDCVFDIGACIGYLALFYNKFFGNIKIHCFEPHPVSYFFLEKNLSSFQNTTLHNFALGDENKEDYMSIPDWESHRLSFLGLMSIGQNSNHLKTKILIKKFDSLAISLQQFKTIYIKIDAEGYEDKILKGMYNLLNSNLNFYLKIEINRNFNNVAKIQSTINFIDKLNFKFFIMQNGKFVNYNKSQIVKHLIYRNTNLFCKRN